MEGECTCPKCGGIIFVTWHSTWDKGNDITTDQILRWKKKATKEKKDFFRYKIEGGHLYTFHDKWCESSEYPDKHTKYRYLFCPCGFYSKLDKFL